MTTKTKIDELKLLAKRYAHARRSNHREALDAIASELGFPHWKGLTVKAKQGWMPCEEELAKADRFVREFFPSLGGKPQFIEQSMSRPIDEPIKVGEIDGKHSPRAVCLLGSEIVYRVSLWTHTKTPAVFKFCRSLIPAAVAVGRMMRRSGSLRKAMAMA